MKIQTIILTITKLIAIVTLSFGAMAVNANQWDGSNEVAQDFVNSIAEVGSCPDLDYAYSMLADAEEQYDVALLTLMQAEEHVYILDDELLELEYTLMNEDFFYPESPEYIQALDELNDAINAYTAAEAVYFTIQDYLFNAQTNVYETEIECEAFVDIYPPEDDYPPEMPPFDDYYPPEDYENGPMIAIATPLDYCNTYPDDEYACLFSQEGDRAISYVGDLEDVYYDEYTDEHLMCDDYYDECWVLDDGEYFVVMLDEGSSCNTNPNDCFFSNDGSFSVLVMESYGENYHGHEGHHEDNHENYHENHHNFDNDCNESEDCDGVFVEVVIDAEINCINDPDSCIFVDGVGVGVSFVGYLGDLQQNQGAIQFDQACDENLDDCFIPLGDQNYVLVMADMQNHCAANPDECVTPDGFETPMIYIASYGSQESHPENYRNYSCEQYLEDCFVPAGAEQFELLMDDEQNYCASNPDDCVVPEWGGAPMIAVGYFIDSHEYYIGEHYCLNDNGDQAYYYYCHPDADFPMDYPDEYFSQHCDDYGNCVYDGEGIVPVKVIEDTDGHCVLWSYDCVMPQGGGSPVIVMFDRHHDDDYCPDHYEGEYHGEDDHDEMHHDCYPYHDDDYCPDHYGHENDGEGAHEVHYDCYPYHDDDHCPDHYDHEYHGEAAHDEMHHDCYPYHDDDYCEEHPEDCDTSQEGESPNQNSGGAPDGAESQIISVLGNPAGLIGKSVSIDIGYNTSDNLNQTPGIGFRVHFDSSVLTINNFSNVLQKDLIVDADGPIADTENYDGDSSTDFYYSFGWAALMGDWPNQELPATVLTLNAEINSLVDGDDQASTPINFSSTSIAAGYQFSANNYDLELMSSTWDFDENGHADALTDGLIMLRYAFGVRGEGLIENALAPESTMSASEMELVMEKVSAMADIDANGEVNALTDGLILMRYLFGLKNESMIDRVVAPNASRTSLESIMQHIERHMPSGEAQ